MIKTGSFRERFHREERLRTADGSPYRVRVCRAGVTRLNFLSGGTINGLAVILSWLRYLVRRPHEWAVEVQELGIDTYRRIVLDERFPTRAQAAKRADAVADAIASGSRPWADTT